MRKLLTLAMLILWIDLCSAQIYYVQDMSTTQIDSLDREHTVVLLPGGILEEHGPYLPSFTDGYVNMAFTKEIADSLVKRKGMKVLIFPIIPLGTGGANEIGRKYNFTGTYTIRRNLLRAILMDLGSDLGDEGFRKIFVINIHGGPNHNQAIDQACDYFNEAYGGKMVNILNLGTSFRSNFLTADERQEEGYTPHAGMEEHSLLYYLQPRFQQFKYKEARPAKATDPANIEIVAKADGWPGYFGSPKLSSPELGEKVWKARSQWIIVQVSKVMEGTYDFHQPTMFQLMERSASTRGINQDALTFDQQKESKQNEWLKSKGLQ